jgi:hypothetical protein
MAVRGVNSEGFNTMVFPVARAGPSFQEAISTGFDSLFNKYLAGEAN